MAVISQIYITIGLFMKYFHEMAIFTLNSVDFAGKVHSCQSRFSPGAGMGWCA